MTSVRLQSQEHKDLLDVIDNLRSQGAGKYVDLPEIIVCGDQSAGKSSVLEAISGFSFPTKDNLCTRFATELILRRGVARDVHVSIVAAPDRPSEEKERLSAVTFDIDVANPNLGSAVETAKRAMDISESKVFSTDVLRVELVGPTQPNLTLVDLPGLFRAGNAEQSIDYAPVVKKLVRSYMQRPRSIILAVVSAKVDFALQEVTELARELDPKGLRTLGLITKPDTLDAGSDSEQSYFKIAHNKDVILRLGWHVLKNRDYKTRDSSLNERNEAEKAFFATGIWINLSPMNVGINALVTRLSKVLTDQILQQLPGLQSDLLKEHKSSEEYLKRLGEPRQSLAQQRRYLFHVSREFSSLVKDASDGAYNHSFFGSVNTEQGRQRRLRAVIQNELKRFSDDVWRNGQDRTIAEDDEYSAGKGIVSRHDYVSEVIELMRRSRGRELLGTFNPMLIGELFTQQCQPWKGLVEKTKDTVVDTVYALTQSALDFVAADETTDHLLQIVNRNIDDLKAELETELHGLLLPHLISHPITYNHYLTDNVQKAQSARREKALEKALKQTLAIDTITSGKTLYDVDPSMLLAALNQRTEVSMERYASELAVDYMQAYYKVARKKFVDDVAVLAVEKCVISKLPGLLSPDMMYDLSDEQVQQYASESHLINAERQLYTHKLKVLENGLQLLKRLNKHRPVPVDVPLKHLAKDEEPEVSAHEQAHAAHSLDESLHEQEECLDDRLNGNSTVTSSTIESVWPHSPTESPSMAATKRSEVRRVEPVRRKKASKVFVDD